MLNQVPIMLAVGAVLGFLSGLGVGGGSLLMLWLTLVAGLDYGAARTINLLFFIPAAVIACLFRWKQGSLQIKQILPATLFGAGSAALFAWVGQRIELVFLKKLFGGLLLLTGLRELFYRPRKAK